MNLSNKIKHKAHELGFDLVGITDASPIEARQVEMFSAWLDSGFAGEMDYLNRNFEKRFNPAELLEDAKSVIVVGLNYKPVNQQSIETAPDEPAGQVVSYACYQDYHPFIKKRLRELTEFICSVTGKNPRFKLCVDSVPLAERALALRAGLGFIGKNHMLINPDFGCQILLGEIITDLKLEPHTQVLQQKSNEPKTDCLIETKCSNCDKCLKVCSTGALRDDGRFDASKCLNYLTIEYKGQIPPDIADKIDTRLIGCEECILVCPYHQEAPVCSNSQFRFYQDRMQINLSEVMNLTENSFKEKFSDSVLNRLGLERLKRNAQICLSNFIKAGGESTG